MPRKSSKTAHVMNLLAGDNPGSDQESPKSEAAKENLAASQTADSPETIKELTVLAQQASIQTQDAPAPPSPISIIDMTSTAPDPVAELIKQQLEEDVSSASGRPESENLKTGLSESQEAVSQADSSALQDQPSGADSSALQDHASGTDSSALQDQPSGADSSALQNHASQADSSSLQDYISQADSSALQDQPSGTDNASLQDHSSRTDHPALQNQPSQASSSALQDYVSQADIPSSLDALSQEAVQTVSEPVLSTPIQPDSPASPQSAANGQQPEPSDAPGTSASQAAEPEGDYKYLNVMEYVVKGMVKEYMEKFDVCPCGRCTADVTALTLTHLPPKYIVVEAPAASPLLNFYSTRLAQQVIVELTKSCCLVKENPHH